jgi:hypothetical protein
MLRSIKKIIISVVDGLRVNVNIDRGRAAQRFVTAPCEVDAARFPPCPCPLLEPCPCTPRPPTAPRPYASRPPANAPPLWPVASPSSSWSHVELKTSSRLKLHRYSRAWERMSSTSLPSMSTGARRMLERLDVEAARVSWRMHRWVGEAQWLSGLVGEAQWHWWVILCKDPRVVDLLLEISWNKHQISRLLDYHNLDP